MQINQSAAIITRDQIRLSDFAKDFAKTVELTRQAETATKLSAFGRTGSDADSRSMLARPVGDPVGGNRSSCGPSAHRSAGPIGRRSSDRPQRDLASRRHDCG
jgi:hypothetical protein